MVRRDAGDRRVQRQTNTIPIVFVNASDPVGSPLRGDLRAPGGNLTGLQMYEASIAGKWLAMLKEIAPRMTRVAFIANPQDSRLRLLPACG